MAVKFWKCQTYKYCLNEWLVEDLTENAEVTRSNPTGTNFMVEWFLVYHFGCLLMHCWKESTWEGKGADSNNLTFCHNFPKVFTQLSFSELNSIESKECIEFVGDYLVIFIFKTTENNALNPPLDFCTINTKLPMLSMLTSKVFTVAKKSYLQWYSTW